MIISVREIGLNWLQFSKVASLGTGIRSALFQTVGTLALLREELNIFVMVGASLTPNSLQNQCGKSSGPHDVHFLFWRNLETISTVSVGTLVPSGILSNSGAV